MTTESSTTIETTRQAVSHSLRPLSRMTYTTCYMISYGVVYATVFLVKSIPQNNPIVQGFIEGGRAAVKAVNESKGGEVASGVESAHPWPA